jgi:hypothetical protein
MVRQVKIKEGKFYARIIRKPALVSICQVPSHVRYVGLLVNILTGTNKSLNGSKVLFVG